MEQSLDDAVSLLFPKLSDSYTEGTATLDSQRAGINPAPTDQVGEFK